MKIHLLLAISMKPVTLSRFVSFSKFLVVAEVVTSNEISYKQKVLFFFFKYSILPVLMKNYSSHFCSVSSMIPAFLLLFCWDQSGWLSARLEYFFDLGVDDGLVTEMLTLHFLYPTFFWLCTM